MAENNYIIEGGEEGKKRLDVLGAVLNPYTKDLLEKDALQGKDFLDLGCGSGTVSLMVAPLLQPGGTVTGVDFDPEIIQLAQEDAAALQINNAVFHIGNVNDMDYHQKFDVVYCRFLLSHLQNPFDVLKKMM